MNYYLRFSLSCNSLKGLLNSNQDLLNLLKSMHKFCRENILLFANLRKEIVYYDSFKNRQPD